jgi:hypothetical protein
MIYTISKLFLSVKCKLPLYDLDGFIFTGSQVDGLCKLITQHSRTLTSLEFIHCTVYEDFINAILDSVGIKGVPKHGIRHLSIVSSSFGKCTVSLPSGLESFLSSARYMSVNMFISKLIHTCIFLFFFRRAIQTCVIFLKFDMFWVTRNTSRLGAMILIYMNNGWCICYFSGNPVYSCFSSICFNWLAMSGGVVWLCL